MNKLRLIAVLLFFMVGMAAHGQKPRPSNAKEYSDNRLDINNVDAPIKPQGGGWFSDENDGFHFPKGTELSTYFSYSFWMGAMDADTNLHLFAERFNQVGHDTWPGPLSLADASIDETTKQQWDRTFKITRQEVTDFLENYQTTGYTIPQHILDWPAHGDPSKGQAWKLAPFVDTDNDGIYNPEHGDYPDFPGDMAQFIIFNDNYASHTESQGQPLGVEVHVMAYAWNMPEDTLMNNTIFLKYKIFNRSQNDYHNAYVGLWSDWDLGYFGDDYVGCDVMRNSVYCYNGSEIDGSGTSGYYGADWPVQTLTLLCGPLMPADDTDNPAYGGPDDCPQGNNILDWSAVNGIGFGDGIVDNERYGLTGFISHSNDNSVLGDPTYAAEYYISMRGFWRDYTKLFYGSVGYPGYGGVVGSECNFIYPGLTDPCNFGTYGIDQYPTTYYGADGWTEASANITPGDRRGLASVGPFNLDAGGMQEMELCLVTLPHSWAVNETGSIRLDSLNRLLSTYQPSLGVREHIPSQSLKIYPNPTMDRVFVEMGDDWNSSKPASVMVYDFQGKLVLTQSVIDTHFQIDMSNFPSGLYLIKAGNLVGKVIKK